MLCGDVVGVVVWWVLLWGCCIVGVVVGVLLWVLLCDGCCCGGVVLWVLLLGWVLLRVLLWGCCFWSVVVWWPFNVICIVVLYVFLLFSYFICMWKFA